MRVIGYLSILVLILAVSGCAQTVTFKENEIDISAGMGGIKAEQTKDGDEVTQKIERTGLINFGSWSIVNI